MSRKMDKTKLSAISLGILTLILGGMQIEDIYKTPEYKQCRVGNDYGTWIQENEYQFTCDITGETSLCWKTTKTRCYFFDEELMIKESIKDKASQIVCDNIRCIEVK